MNRRSSNRWLWTGLGRLARLVVAVAVILLASPSWAMAQAAKEETEKAYTLPYIMVILVIAGSLVVVLRPAGRSEEIKLQPYED